MSQKQNLCQCFAFGSNYMYYEFISLIFSGKNSKQPSRLNWSILRLITSMSQERYFARQDLQKQAFASRSIIFLKIPMSSVSSDLPHLEQFTACQPPLHDKSNSCEPGCFHDKFRLSQSPACRCKALS